MNKLQGKKPRVKTKSLFAGIVLNMNEIQIDKTLKIRKAKKKDLEHPRKIGEHSYDYDRAIEESFCVVEYDYFKEREH